MPSVHGGVVNDPMYSKWCSIWASALTASAAKLNALVKWCGTSEIWHSVRTTERWQGEITSAMSSSHAGVVSPPPDWKNMDTIVLIFFWTFPMEQLNLHVKVLSVDGIL